MGIKTCGWLDSTKGCQPSYFLWPLLCVLLGFLQIMSYVGLWHSPPFSSSSQKLGRIPDLSIYRNALPLPNSTSRTSSILQIHTEHIISLSTIPHPDPCHITSHLTQQPPASTPTSPLQPYWPLSSTGKTRAPSLLRAFAHAKPLPEGPFLHKAAFLEFCTLTLKSSERLFLTTLSAVRA